LRPNSYAGLQWATKLAFQPSIIRHPFHRQREGGNGRCATIQSAAADRLSTVTVGGGSNRSSSPWQYLPVRTSTAPPSPARKAPATSASASSPTITACFGGNPCSQALLQRI